MVVAKVAISRGMNKNVLVFYSFALSTLLLLPCALILDRSNRDSFTFSTLSKIFLLALFGFVSLTCTYAGLECGSPMLGSAMLNLIPAFTFILAIIFRCFRMEKLDWRSTTSLAKSLGAIVSLTGAFIMTFYKGPPIMKTSSVTILGGLLFAAEALLSSAWYILQALILKKFTAVLTIMFYLCFFGTMLSALYSLIVVEDSGAWQLKLDMGLFSTSYSAVVSIVFRSSLCAWCLSKTGPVYVSVFKSLGIIFALIMDVIFLGEVLRLGIFIGASITVTGFYAVMWGKAKEDDYMNSETGVGSFRSSKEKVPLLQARGGSPPPPPPSPNDYVSCGNEGMVVDKYDGVNE
ncbi:WAT1-related protein At5g40240 [Hevea brasiliensis]|uniref:WAT1-related protein At5g40240 n=1 Tax=Hevea brasiliensis TaxID=3981 RepID=UPI0025DB665F|nr:WAT1-related protein At5g40240 [Hevea brasiliensis]